MSSPPGRLPSRRSRARGHTSRLGRAGLVRAALVEAVASARSQRVASAAALLVVAAMCATVLLTTGRAVGAEQQVLSTIDAAGARSITIRADEAAGVDTTVIAQLDRIDGITWSGAFSTATDVRTTAYPGGTPVPLRTLWTTDPTALGIPLPRGGTDTTAADDGAASSPAPPGQAADPVAYASPEASDLLGMDDDVGGIAGSSGASLPVVGTLSTPTYLSDLEPLVVRPQDTVAPPRPVSVLVVLADSPQLVEPVRDVVVSLLAVSDPTTITVTTSEDLTSLRDVVAGQLRTFSASLLSGVLAVATLLVAGVLAGVVTLRRKDFGRRRALGASRSLIVGLLLTQTFLLSSAGAALGSLVATAALLATSDPLPGADFYAAVAVLAVGAGTIAALLPAMVASRRDPLTELRVP